MTDFLEKKCFKCPNCAELIDTRIVDVNIEEMACIRCDKVSKIEDYEIIDFGNTDKTKKTAKRLKSKIMETKIDKVETKTKPDIIKEEKKKEEIDHAATAKKTMNSAPARVSGNNNYDNKPAKNYPTAKLGSNTDHLSINSTRELRLALMSEGEVKGAKADKLYAMGLVVKEQFDGVSSLSLAKMVSCFQAEFIKSEKTKNPIAHCTPSSIAFAMIDAGKAEIYPDGKNGALIVRQNYKTKQPELTFMPMAQGIQKAAMASGVARKFNVQIVYEEDLFKVKKGQNGGFIIEHEPDFSSNQDEIKAVYCEIFLTNGEIITEILRRADIQQFKDKYDKGGDTPWAEWGGEMIRKSVVKRACKYLPSPTFN